MPFVRIPTLIPARLIAMYGDGKERWTEYTAAHARQVVANGNAQIAAGLTVPVCWMHDTDAKPAYLSHRPFEKRKSNPHEWMAKGFIGYVRRWEFDPAGSHAVAVAEIFDPKDAEQFLRVGKVSPCVQPQWRDERGRVWDGFSVQHIASTPKPKQRDIPNVTAETEYRPTWVQTELSGSGPAYLSFDSTLGRVMTETEIEPVEAEVVAKKVPPAAMSDEPGEKADRPPEAKPEEKKPSADAACLMRFAEILKQLGVHVAGEPKTLDELLIAAETGVATKNGGPVGGDGDIDDLPPEEGTPDAKDHMPAGNPMFYMSFTPGQVKGCEKIADGYRRGYEADIRAAIDDGQINLEIAEERLAKPLAAANLSFEPHTRFFTEDMEFVEPEVAKLIAFVRTLPKGRFSKESVAARNGQAANLSHTPPGPPKSRPLTPPAMGDVAMSAEEVQAEAARRAQALGIPTQ